MALEVGDQLLDARGSNRIERGCRFVEKQNLRLGGKCPSDAQTLLLSTGEIERQVLQSTLDLVPQRRSAQRLLDFFMQDRHLALSAHPQAVGYIFEDGFRKRVGLLKHHADAHANFDRIDLWMKQVGVVGIESDLALVTVAWIQIVHAVEAAKIGRLATTGRTDQGRHLLLVQRHVDIFQRVKIRVVEAQISGLRFDAEGSRSQRAVVHLGHVIDPIRIDPIQIDPIQIDLVQIDPVRMTVTTLCVYASGNGYRLPERSWTTS